MQFNIRNMPDELHRQLKIQAATGQTTMEAVALTAIREHLDSLPGRPTQTTQAGHAARRTV